MGRKKKKMIEILAEKYVIKDLEGVFLVLYSFPVGCKPGRKRNFYRSFERFKKDHEGEAYFINRNAILCKKLSIAKAIEELARKSGGSARVYKVEADLTGSI